MESTLNLQLLSSVDWPVLKAARLKALGDSPNAFLSRFEHEQRFSEAEWRRAFDASTWIVAQEADRLIGLARSVAEPSKPRVKYVESIWVAPASRRSGVCRSLMHRLAAIEGRRGATHLLLWVMEDNHPARHAYAAIGFKPTGERQFLSALGRFELQFALAIK